jgi:hypothetical protein
MEWSDDDNEYDEDNKDGSRLHDALLRKIGMFGQRCIEYKRLVKRLKMDLRLSKSHARQTRRQIRINYDWDGKEANFTNWVLSFVNEYLFPRHKFLKDKWMEYDHGPESLLTFVQGKVKNPRSSRVQGSMGESYMPNHSSKVCHYKVQSQQCDSKNIQE